MKRLLACLALCASLSASAQDDNCTILGIQDLTQMVLSLQEQIDSESTEAIDTCSYYPTEWGFGFNYLNTLDPACDYILVRSDSIPDIPPTDFVHLTLAEGHYEGQRIMVCAEGNFIPMLYPSTILTRAHYQHCFEAIWIFNEWRAIGPN